VTTLILVRHGQTEWNREARWQGQADPPLNARGRQQACDTASELSNQPFDALFSSDLRRALETAQIIGTELGLGVVPDERLREINLGLWQGMLADEIEAQYPKKFHRWRTEPLTVRPPEGETVTELAARVLEAIAEISHRFPDGRVGVVAHELPIAVVVSRAQGVDVARLREFIPGTGSWREVVWNESD
jgi:broad specificity phosphatase PhoE